MNTLNSANLLDDLQELNQPNNPFPFAPFWKRALASVIDTIIAVVFALVWLMAVGVLAGLLVDKIGVNSGFLESLGTFVWLVGGIFFVPSLYFIRGESSPKQATVGKEMMGLQVVDMEFQRITFWHASGRLLLRWISTVLYLIGYLPALFTQKHQTFHDLVAKTLVVEKRSFNQNFQ
jgi:uncharacterized RDD family membrane protein YckC